MRKRNPNLLGFEALSDVAKFLVDAEPHLFLVLTIADVADEDGETSHSGQRHRRSEPPPRGSGAPPYLSSQAAEGSGNAIRVR